MRPGPARMIRPLRGLVVSGGTTVHGLAPVATMKGLRRTNYRTPSRLRGHAWNRSIGGVAADTTGRLGTWTSL